MRFCVALLLLCSTCFGQSVTPTKVNVTSGYTNPRVVGPYVLHGDFSAPVSRPGVLLTIETASKDQRLFDLFAEQIPSFEVAELQTLPDGTVLLVGDGRYRITAFFENPSAVKRMSVELGPKPDPKPDPDPDPKPDVPPDEFDNIGQRVAVWSKGLPRRNEVAVLYAECATNIAENEKLTQNQAIDLMVAARKNLLKPDELKAYQPMIDQLNADLKKRWPMHALVTSSYFKAIATGLGGAK